MIFGNEESEYSYLSPFSKHNIRENGVVFSSVYNYYLYRKFNNINATRLKIMTSIQQERVLMQISNNRTNRIVTNWDAVKYNIMKRGFMLKFEQHPVLLKKFEKLDYSDYKYNIPSFSYWGYTGKNKLCELLCELRMEYGFQLFETKNHSHLIHEEYNIGLLQIELADEENIVQLQISNKEDENTTQLQISSEEDNVEQLQLSNELLLKLHI